MQKKDLIVRIAGGGGQGIVTSGEILYRAIAQTGLNILTESTFASGIMGGDAVYQVRISCSPIFSQGDRVDILVAMSGGAYQGNKANLATGCILIYDEETVKPEGLEGVILYPIPMSSIGKGLGSPISRNMVALGALTKLLCLPEDRLRDDSKQVFKRESFDIFRRVRRDLSIPVPKDGKTVRLTPTQVRLNGGMTHLNPLDIESDPLVRLRAKQTKGDRT